MSGHSLRFLSETLGSGSVTTKPKRRAYLLKRKALTTGFFDNKGKDEKEKGEHKTQYRLIASSPGYIRRHTFATMGNNRAISRIRMTSIYTVAAALYSPLQLKPFLSSRINKMRSVRYRCTSLIQDGKRNRGRQVKRERNARVQRNVTSGRRASLITSMRLF